VPLLVATSIRAAGAGARRWCCSVSCDVLLAAGAVTALALHPPACWSLSTAAARSAWRFFCWCSRRAPPRAMRRASLPSLLARSWVKPGSEGQGGPVSAAARDDDA